MDPRVKHEGPWWMSLCHEKHQRWASIGGGAGVAGNARDGGKKDFGGAGVAGNARDGGKKDFGGAGVAGNARDGGKKESGVPGPACVA